MGIRSFLRGNGDHGSLARGDATRLMPSAGGAGRFPGPPPRAAVGGANFPGPPPRGGSGGSGYNDLPQRPGRGAKDPGSLPQRPNPNQIAMTSNPATPAMQAATWNEARKDSPASKSKPKYDPSTDKRPFKQLNPDEQSARQQWAKEKSYNPKVNYQSIEDWASSRARHNGWYH